MQKFSPFLLMSVGGIISTLSSEQYPYQRVYCQTVKRDIIPNETGVNGEKEVFVKKLKTEDMAGVYVDDNKILELIQNDNNFSQGNFYQAHEDELNFRDDVIGKWRWEINMQDCLPRRLRDASVII